jgi:hypothetical protein
MYYYTEVFLRVQDEAISMCIYFRFFSRKYHINRHIFVYAFAPSRVLFYLLLVEKFVKEQFTVIIGES